jgi:uncharacterized OsmC-like protein
MNSAQLRATQSGLKELYRSNPDAAVVRLSADGSIDDPKNLVCSVQTGRALVAAGLHPASGGDGSLACSGDMLLQALVACAGVTLRAVAANSDLRLRGGRVSAEGDLDFRGTLGVDREAPVGFRAIRLRFDLEGEIDPVQFERLQRQTERYCVVYQTIARGVPVETTFALRK